MRPLHLVLALGLALACASAPPTPSPGLSSLYGEVRLVPREGVTPHSGGGAYGDRRMRDVSFVDYAHPGYMVVYTEGTSPAGRSLVSIRESATRVRLEPAYAALGAGGRLEVRNETAESHVVSLPQLGFLHPLGPGETAELPLESDGEFELFVLDAPGAEARIFAAPGPFAVTSYSGGYELRDLPPGRHRIGVWHPRFPPASRWAELAPDTSLRLDLEVGVQGLPSAGEDRAAAP